MRSTIVLALFLTASLGAMEYQGPLSWQPWFESWAQELDEQGWEGINQVTVETSGITVQLKDGSEGWQPFKGDFKKEHLQELFLRAYLKGMEPFVEPLHFQATLGFLLGLQRLDPEAEALARFYACIEQDYPNLIAALWKEDHANGQGHSETAREKAVFDRTQKSFGSLLLQTLDAYPAKLLPSLALLLPPEPLKKEGDLYLRPVFHGLLWMANLEVQNLTAPTLQIHAPGLWEGQMRGVIWYDAPLEDFELVSWASPRSLPLKGVKGYTFLYVPDPPVALHHPPICHILPVNTYPFAVAHQRIHVEGKLALWQIDLMETQGMQALILFQETPEGVIPISMLPVVSEASGVITYTFTWTLPEAEKPNYWVYGLTQEGILYPLP